MFRGWRCPFYRAGRGHRGIGKGGGGEVMASGFEWRLRPLRLNKSRVEGGVMAED
jgi:hypothetical protein